MNVCDYGVTTGHVAAFVFFGLPMLIAIYGGMFMLGRRIWKTWNDG